MRGDRAVGDWLDSQGEAGEVGTRGVGDRKATPLPAAIHQHTETDELSRAEGGGKAGAGREGEVDEIAVVCDGLDAATDFAAAEGAEEVGVVRGA